MTAGCGLSTRSPRRLWSTPWSASRCFPALAPHLSLHIPPGTCTAQLHSQHASHVHLTSISPAPHLHCTRPPLHPSLARRPPGCAADGRLSKHAHPRQGGNRLVRPAGRGSTSSGCCSCTYPSSFQLLSLLLQLLPPSPPTPPTHHHHTQVGIQVCACEDELGQAVYLYKLPEPPAAHSAYCTSAGT